MYKGRKQVFLFDGMVDNITSKIQEWNGKTLSFGGKLTLIQAVLMAIPIYHMQCMEIPATVIERVEKILNKFLWGNNEGGGITWAGWESLCFPYEEGGLNVRGLQDLQNVFSMKLWYAFRKQESLWSQFMFEKYCKGKDPVEVKVKITDSRTWKRMLKIRDLAEGQMHWINRDGGRQVLWKLSSDGDFNTSQTWDYLRHESNIAPSLAKIWNSIVPKKCAFLTWRVMRGWLPVDCELRKKGLIVVSKCQHCEAFETINHTFFECNIAWKVWSHFSLLFGVHINNRMSIKQAIQLWTSSSKAAKHIRNVIPSLICWSLWEKRNKRKHKGLKVTHWDVIARIQNFIFKLGVGDVIKWSHWKGDTSLMTHLHCYISPPTSLLPKVIYWHPPPPRMFKLNVDGSSCQSKGDSGGGSILRDGHSDVIWAQCRTYGRYSPLHAEFTALLDGLTKCCNQRQWGILVETDSKIVVDIIQTGRTPWHLKLLVGNIKRLLSACRGSITHIFRESNSGADFLAKLAMEEGQTETFDRHTIPPKLKAIVKLEKDGVGYIRS